MTDASLPEAESPRRGGFLKKALMALIAIAVLGGGGFAGGYFFAQQTVEEEPESDLMSLIESTERNTFGGPQRVPRPTPDDTLFQTSYYEFPVPLTTNLRGSRRFLQVGIGVATQYDEAVVENVERHQLALQSDMLAVASGFTEEEVTGQAGRDALSMALKDAMNARLEDLEGFGGIEDVFFPSFVMQ